MVLSMGFPEYVQTVMRPSPVLLAVPGFILAVVNSTLVFVRRRSVILFSPRRTPE